MNELTLSQIEKMIFIIRGMRVMLDSDLAKLYGVDTKRLNEQVKRNIERFPGDFMFQPTFSELADLRSQFATLNGITAGNHISKYLPYLFTENGVAMLSSVLNSPTAIQVNISIMRIFTRHRSYYFLEQRLENKIQKLEHDTTGTFKIVFERLDGIEGQPENSKTNRKKIGLKNE
ncbi:MAG: ORF6N domain-containing protein [Bacteriovoracaceae bacterium]|nr:ORF6N domain-containing protein [Bacteriovoracaceae bacterium]